MPLSMVKPGSKVKLVNIEAGRGLQSRLADLGILPGVEIDVIANTFKGPFIVGVKGSRVVLGRGMAAKMNVS